MAPTGQRDGGLWDRAPESRLSRYFRQLNDASGLPPIRPAVIAPMAAGIVLAAAFITWEHRAAQPMMPLRLFGARSFAAGTAATFFHASVVFGGQCS